MWTLFIPFTSVDTIHSFQVCGHYSFLSRPWTLFIPFTSVDTIHFFHVRGHYSFLSRPWTLFIPFTSVDTIHFFHFLFLGDRSLNPITSLCTWVSTPPVVSLRLILQAAPAHHACSTYVLSLHPRFNLRSRLLPSTSTKVASTIVSCDLQSRR